METSALKSFFQRWLINTLAVLVAVNVVKGLEYDSFISLLVASLLLGILNAFVRPVIMLLSLPLLLFSLGLFTIVINAFLLFLVGQIVKSFQVASFGSAFWGALVISLVSMIANRLTGAGQSRIEVKRRNRPPPPRQDGGSGPVIDV